MVRAKLCELMAAYGPGVCDDARRCEGLLRDVCGENKREISALVSALKEGIPADLRSSQGGLPADVLLARLADRLQSNAALTEEASRWAAESWALALGVISRAQLGSACPQGNQSLAQFNPSLVPTPGTQANTIRPRRAGSRTALLAPTPSPVIPANATASAVPLSTSSSNGINGPFPKELDRWNWGAFIFSWIWAIAHGVWIGLLALVPYAGVVMAFVLAFKGNEWAWEHRSFATVDEFKEVQAAWARAGAIWVVVLLILWLLFAALLNH